jgi:hypothetical protein
MIGDEVDILDIGVHLFILGFTPIGKAHGGNLSSVGHFCLIEPERLE